MTDLDIILMNASSQVIEVEDDDAPLSSLQRGAASSSSSSTQPGRRQIADAAAQAAERRRSQGENESPSPESRQILEVLGALASDQPLPQPNVSDSGTTYDALRSLMSRAEL